jgi:D-methionine transport system ATP-binding protein
MSETMIQIESLSKTYETKVGSVHALQNIDLQIQKGEIFGIIGMSGAGKSTLVRCINMLERPTSGKVIFDGQDMAAMNENELRKARQSMSMIFQQFNLLMQRTAEQNICFPLEIAGVSKEQAKKRVTELLELVGLSDRAKSYPNQLSGGQKQRVAIARALALEPKVLLCDEATSALDPTTTVSILKLLKEINTRLGITIVIITHQMSVIEEICNRVAIISDSKIAECGEVQEIFRNPKTEAARRLVLPETVSSGKGVGTRKIRMVFDGVSSSEPVVAELVLHFRTPVNIMHADTKDVGGTAMGQMLLQLPADPEIADKMIEFIKARGLTVEEVSDRG